ncbi:MAG: alpha/beta hydrolase [Planctomycetaceae bacterium]|nr:alpha/beta hydrolase [Planctomycetaceae bacterium]
MRFNQRGLWVCGLILSWAASVQAAGPEPIKLWPDGAPGAVGNEPEDIPELRIYQPDPAKATGCGIVVCPGGGYAVHATDHEGHQVAKWLNTIGVTGFVLKYRLGRRYKHPAPLQDAQRAIRYVRANAKDLGVDPDRVGIMGFSAGGHLASTLATHFDAGDPDNEDPTERQSCRPNFAVLCYAVVSFTADFSHSGSANNLLGKDADPKMLENLSNEKQVTSETPPTFLFHTGEDTGVPVENSLAFYQALRKVKVPAELHVFEKGPHGVGLAPGRPALANWNTLLGNWLKASGFLTGPVVRAEVKGTATVDGKPIGFGTVTFHSSAAPNAPAVSVRIRNGQFSLGKDDGPILGSNVVRVFDFGAVKPVPTIENATLHEATTNIRPDSKPLDLKFSSK